MNDCNDSLPKQGIYGIARAMLSLLSIAESWHKSPKGKGWGGSLVEGFLLTLHHNTLAPRKLHHFVKCFVFLNHFVLCSAIFSVTPKSWSFAQWVCELRNVSAIHFPITIYYPTILRGSQICHYCKQTLSVYVYCIHHIKKSSMDIMPTSFLKPISFCSLL